MGRCISRLPKEKLEEAFKQRICTKTKIDPETGCWIWEGRVTTNGYHRSTFARKNWYVHRMSYVLYVGEIPRGFDVCHKCDNRRCCNPAHLFVGTRLDNMADAVSKGRQAKGEKHPWTKIRRDDVYEILKLRKLGMTLKAIAALYNVTGCTIGNAIKLRTFESREALCEA